MNFSFGPMVDGKSVRARFGSGGAVRSDLSTWSSRDRMVEHDIESSPHMSFTSMASIACGELVEREEREGGGREGREGRERKSPTQSIEMNYSTMRYKPKP